MLIKVIKRLIYIYEFPSTPEGVVYGEPPASVAQLGVKKKALPQNSVGVQ
jgi:hypothetical protein